MIHSEFPESSRLMDSSVLGDPGTEVMSTIESIRPSTSCKNENVWFFRKEMEVSPITAWNVPRDGSDNVSGSDQWTAWISLADTLSGNGEGANLVGEDELGVASSVSRLAVSVGQGGCGQPLEVVWSRTSGDCGTTPSRDDSVNATSDMSGSEGNCLNVGIEGHKCSGTGDRDTGGQEIVRWRISTH